MILFYSSQSSRIESSNVCYYVSHQGKLHMCQCHTRIYYIYMYASTNILVSTLFLAIEFIFYLVFTQLDDPSRKSVPKTHLSFGIHNICVYKNTVIRPLTKEIKILKISLNICGQREMATKDRLLTLKQSPKHRTTILHVIASHMHPISPLSFINIFYFH